MTNEFSFFSSEESSRGKRFIYHVTPLMRLHHHLILGIFGSFYTKLNLWIRFFCSSLTNDHHMNFSSFNPLIRIFLITFTIGFRLAKLINFCSHMKSVKNSTDRYLSYISRRQSHVMCNYEEINFRSLNSRSSVP